eukprot:Blabericola_migrator_1__13255@NODE_923_length_6034_cov_34_268309_g642_i0_p3_GENE_NODE_923_length_6034_cov_34_268309_g642_i0NODE_923_length_6034_cov_34_268309_g642_i0_p3_ORF_typecomplete_len162_score9_59_NODE_923_length_6034_cov_34_268309_g642_i021482633
MHEGQPSRHPSENVVAHSSLHENSVCRTTIEMSHSFAREPFKRGSIDKMTDVIRNGFSSQGVSPVLVPEDSEESIDASHHIHHLASILAVQGLKCTPIKLACEEIVPLPVRRTNLLLPWRTSEKVGRHMASDIADTQVIQPSFLKCSFQNSIKRQETSCFM